MLLSAHIFRHVYYYFTRSTLVGILGCNNSDEARAFVRYLTYVCHLALPNYVNVYH